MTVESATTGQPSPSLLSGFWPVIRGLLWAAIGFVVGAVVAGVISLLAGGDAWDFEWSVTVAYPFAIVGWLMGVGMWDRWGREWFGLSVDKASSHDWRRYFAFTLDHKVIGIQYIITFIALFLLGGLLAMVLRAHLTDPAGALLGPGGYNQVMSLHGIVMIAVAVAIIVGGFGNYFVPLLIGARDVAFPRINALSFWLVPPVAITLLASQLFGGWDSGWTAYPPLSVVNQPGQVLFNLAIVTFGLSSILGGLNFLTTIVKMRAPGMTLGRMPIFVWSMVTTSVIALLFTQFLAAALLMVLVDRVLGTVFFDAGSGGSALLYEHVFWFYSHPAVYIFVGPALGILLEVLVVFARKPLFAYKWAVAGFLGILGLSGIVWAHHLFTSGMPDFLLGPFLVTTELISIPTGLIFLAALGTIWGGRLWLRTPMLFALGVIFLFLIGGITGIFLADVPTDINLQDTYFVVAHFHYTIIGGEIFALFAGLYYWWPKMTGRMYSERLAQAHFWLMFIGFNMIFIPMFWVGLQGMNRRVASYEPELAFANTLISLSSVVMALSVVPLLANAVWSLVMRRAEKAGSNPWHAHSLEWQTTSPPPEENFEEQPVVTGDPYRYGEPGTAHVATPKQATGEA